MMSLPAAEKSMLSAPNVILLFAEIATSRALFGSNLG
jgi:hypothetical protein